MSERPSPDRPPVGSVSATPLRALAVAALFGALGGWLIVVTASALGFSAPAVPWTAPIGLALVVALVGALAYTTYARIHLRRERMEPHRAVAFLVLGKASALAGALVAAGYLVFALLFVGRIEADAARERVVRSLVATGAGVALCAAGLLLERACRVPRDPDDEEDNDSAADTPA